MALPHLAVAMDQLGDKNQAREHLTRVLEVSPGSESAAKADDLLKMLDG